MIVNWTAPKGGLHVVPNPAGNDLILHPGPNEIPTDTWSKCRAHVLDRIAAGDIVEVGVTIATEDVEPKKGPGGKIIEAGKTAGDLDKVTEFKDLPVNQASKLASETVVVATLKTWLETETRGAVAKAIRSQLTKLEDKAAGKTEGEV